MKKDLTKEQLLQACSTNYTRKETAAFLQISLETLRTKLKLFNINFNDYCLKDDLRNCIHPEINESWLIQHWVNTTKSIKQLAEELNISDSLIESRINKYNLTKTYKYSLNTKKFFDLNDPHIWYIAGLANTDGYFPKDMDACTFEFVGEDEYQLLKEIKAYYESSQEIASYRRTDKYHSSSFYTHYLRLQTPGLQDFFIKNFNICLRKKTFMTDTPKQFLTEDCAKAYIRGCIDGDGYISKDAKVLQVCTASSNFINHLYETIYKFTGITGTIAIAKRKTGEFPIMTFRTNKAKQVLAWLYSLDNCFRLNRKYLRFINNK